MTHTILFANAVRRKAPVKTIDYIIAIPAALAVNSFINGFKNSNPFLNFGRLEVATVASIVTLEATAETVARYRIFLADVINEIKEG